MALSKIEASSTICIIGCTLIILIACSSLKAAQSLRISSIEVPPAAMNSSQVTLVCNYALQGDQLYSVKWYKNYVEFYRFQPVESASELQLQSQLADEQLHSKHEFELDGINLNLAKSNSTHVHLRQVNLASEGTYKCEVSADSPSFATISIERQMKVYVLPKQKLSIIDNSATIQQQQQQNANAEPTISSRNSNFNSVSLHNINDIVNLTCHSGPSRPAAKLTWLLNDSKVSPTSKWLSTEQQNISIGESGAKLTLITSSSRSGSGGGGINNNLEQQSSHNMQLVDSKLTLSFRLQPNHLLGNQTNDFYNSYSKQQLHSIRFRCVAEFSVEFTSDASILVSGGKTTPSAVGQRQRQHARSQGHIDESTFQQNKSSTTTLRLMTSQASPAAAPASPLSALSVAVGNLYRWPRPSQSGATPPSGADRRASLLDQPANDLGGDHWSSSSPMGDHSELATEQAPVTSRSAPQLLTTRQHSLVVVWTNRQLRAQAEHIDQLLRLSRPNELESPIIVGKILKSNDDDAFNDDDNGNGNNDNNEDETSQIMADNTAMMEALGQLATLSPSNKNKPFQLDNEPPTTAYEDAERRALASSIDVPLQPAAVNQDYELNDVVQFSCISRAGRPDSSDLRKKVRLEWFINNKEITTNYVNAYDGFKFFHNKPVKLARSRPKSIRRQSDNLRGESASSIIDPEVGPDHKHNHKSNITPDKGALEQHLELQSGVAVERRLLIEFSSSLFQLKELDLKCRTTVEQPLIEYENQLIASVPSSSQYIEVIQQKHKVNPSLRALQHRQNGRSGYQQRNRNANKQLSSGGSSTTMTMTTTMMMSQLTTLAHWPLIAMTISFVVIQRF